MASYTQEIVLLPVAGLRPHPAGESVPKMRQEEWSPFLADVLRRGVVDPIVVQQGTKFVLDGRHRLEASNIRGDETIAARYVDLDEAGQIDFTLRAAVLRRHLNDTQRSMLGARLKGSFEEEAKERERMGRETLPDPGQAGRARDKAGESVGVSGRSIDHASKVLANGSPALVKACDSGEVPVSVAAKLAELPKSEQSKIVSAGPAAVREAVKTKQCPYDHYVHRLNEVHSVDMDVREEYESFGGLIKSKGWPKEKTKLFCEMLEGYRDTLTEAIKEVKQELRR